MIQCKHAETCKLAKERHLTPKKYLFVFSTYYSMYMPQLLAFLKHYDISPDDIDFQTVLCSYKSWELDQYQSLTQVKKCRSYFLPNLSNYETVVAFGNHAVKLFVNKGNIFNYMEYPYVIGNTKIYSTFPIYEIMNNRTKAEIFNYTLHRVVSYTPKFPEYQVIKVETEKDVYHLKSEIEKTKLIVFDTETNGLLSVFYKGEGKVQTVAVSATVDKVYVFPEDKIELFNLLKSDFENSDNIIVAHNIQFDLQVIQIYFGFNVKGTLRDTMLMGYLINEQQELSLKTMASQVGIFYTEEEETQFKTGKELSEEDFLRYNAKDVAATHLLYIKLLKESVEENVYNVLNTILAPLQRVLVKIQSNGMSIDKKKLLELQDSYKKQLDDLLLQMKSVPQVKKYEEKYGELNINSTQQLIKLLTEFYGVKLTKTTKKGSLKVDKKILDKLRDSIAKDFVEPLLEYKEKSKLLSTYLKSFTDKDYIGKDNSLHSNFLISTGTGRLSSNSPNLQNIAGNKDIKSLLIPKKDNHILINADYSSCELRVSAGISNEKSMIEAFKNGLDLHAKVGAEVFGGEEKTYKEDKKKRTMVKAINFGLLYGMGAYTLAERIGVRPDEAQKYIDDYYKTYRNIQATIRHYIQFAANNGYVVLPFGKRRFLLDITNTPKPVPKSNTFEATVYTLLNKKKMSAEREAYNTIVQGTSVFFTYLSLIRIQNYIEANNLDAYIVNTVHDSIVISVNKNQAYTLLKSVLNLMSDYHYDFLNEVPLKADAEIGYDYGHLHEVDKDMTEEEFNQFMEGIKSN